MSFGKTRAGGGDRARDLGLLAVRLGIGASLLVFHGYAKITAGPDRWMSLGKEMQHFGVGFLPVVWGFLAALAESLGSILLMLGLLFRPAAGLLACTMLVAAVRHLDLPPGAPNAGWSGASHALELLAVFLGLILTGPGRFSLAPRWLRG